MDSEGNCRLGEGKHGKQGVINDNVSFVATHWGNAKISN
jgi:hypothetical protein